MGSQEVAVQDVDGMTKRRKLETKLMYIVVRKAHLTFKKSFVELLDGREVMLKKWLHGMRKAASSWEEFYTEVC